MAEVQLEPDALVSFIRPELGGLGALVENGQLPQDTKLSQALLDVLRDPSDPDPSSGGVDTLVVDGTSATRSVSGNGLSNIIMVEVPGKGSWTFDGTTGVLTQQS